MNQEEFEDATDNNAYSRALQILVNDNAVDLYQSLRFNHDPLGTGLVSAASLGKVISKHLGLTGKDIGILLSRGAASSFQISPNDLNARSGIPPPVKVRYQDILQTKPSPLQEKAATTSLLASTPNPASPPTSPIMTTTTATTVSPLPSPSPPSPMLLRQKEPHPPSFTSLPPTQDAQEAQDAQDAPLLFLPRQVVARTTTTTTTSALPDGGAASRRLLQESRRFVPAPSTPLRHSLGPSSFTPTYSQNQFQGPSEPERYSSTSAYGNSGGNDQHEGSYFNYSAVGQDYALKESKIQTEVLRIQLSESLAKEQLAMEETEELYNRLQASAVRETNSKNHTKNVDRQIKNLQHEFTRYIVPKVASQNETLQLLHQRVHSSEMSTQREQISATLKTSASKILELSTCVQELRAETMLKEETAERAREMMVRNTSRRIEQLQLIVALNKWRRINAQQQMDNEINVRERGAVVLMSLIQQRQKEKKMHGTLSTWKQMCETQKKQLSQAIKSRAGACMLYQWSTRREHCTLNIAFSKWNQSAHREQVQIQNYMMDEMKFNLEDCISKLGDSIANTNAVSNRANNLSRELDAMQEQWSQAARKIHLLEATVNRCQNENHGLKQELKEKNHQVNGLEAKIGEALRKEHGLTQTLNETTNQLTQELNETKSRIGKATANVMLLESELSSSKLLLSATALAKEEQMQSQGNGAAANETVVAAIEATRSENKEEHVQDMMVANQQWHKQVTVLQVEIAALVADRNNSMVVHSQTRHQLAEAMSTIEEQKTMLLQNQERPNNHDQRYEEHEKHLLRINDLETQNSNMEKQNIRLQHQHVMRTMKSTLRKMQNQRLWCGFSRWRAVVMKEQVAEKYTRLQHQHVMRTMKSTLRKMQNQRLWFGFSRWCAVVVKEQEAEKYTRLQHQHVMRTMKSTLHKMQNQRLWFGFSRWCAVVVKEHEAEKNTLDESARLKKYTEEHEKHLGRINDLETHNLNVQKQYAAMQHRHVMRTIRTTLRKMQNYMLWRGYSRWCAVVVHERETEETEKIEQMWSSKQNTSNSQIEKDNYKKQHQLIEKHHADMKRLNQNMLHLQKRQVRRGQQLVAVVVVHWWHTRIERAWRKWKTSHNESLQMDFLQHKAINKILHSHAARKYQTSAQAHIPILKWRVYTMDAAKHEAREKLLQSIVGRSLLRKLQSSTQRVFSGWSHHVQGEKTKRAALKRQEMEANIAAYKLEQQKTRELAIISKFNRVMSTNLRRLFVRWLASTMESKFDKKMATHREFKSDVKFLAKMSNTVRSSLIRWREYIYTVKLIRLEDKNNESRILNYLKHILQSKVRQIVSRWRQYVVLALHEKKVEHEKREAKIRNKIRVLFQASKRTSLQKWIKLVHEAKFERLMQSHKSTRVESMILSRLSRSLRSSWIQWREHIHAIAMEKLLFDANENKVMRMIRTMLMTSVRKMVTKWHKYVLWRKMERQTLKHQETYVATKLASIMMSKLRYFLSRWQKYTHTSTVAKHKATAIMHRLLRSTLSRCMTTWHRVVFNTKFERRENIAREARAFDMLSSLVSKKSRRVLIRWHKFVLMEKHARDVQKHAEEHGETRREHAEARAFAMLTSLVSKRSRRILIRWHKFVLMEKHARDVQKHAEEHGAARLEHALRITNQILIRFSQNSMTFAWKTWSGFVNNKRKTEDHQDAILKKAAVTIRRILYRGKAIAFHRLSRHTHRMQSHAQQIQSDQRKIIRELIINLNRRMSDALATWRKAVHLNTVEEIKKRHLLDRKSLLHVQKSQEHLLLQHGIAKKMQKTLLEIQLVPMKRESKRVQRRQSISHGGTTAENFLSNWKNKSLRKGFYIWSNALRLCHKQNEKKERARTITRRVLSRIANKEAAAAFHRWRRLRYKEIIQTTMQQNQKEKKQRVRRLIQRVLFKMTHKALGAGFHQWCRFSQLRYKEMVGSSSTAARVVHAEMVQQRVAKTMKMVVHRMHRLKIWRAMNKWCTWVAMGRVLEGANHRQDQLMCRLVSKEQILYARLMLEPMVRWIQKSKLRAFTSWAYHTHVGVRIHIRSRKRESMLRASNVLLHARLPDSRISLLHRGWNTWRTVVGQYARRKHEEQAIVYKFNRTMATKLRHSFRRWATSAMESKFDKKMATHREFKSDVKFLAKMSNTLRSTLIRWREYIYTVKLIRLENKNNESRILNLLKHTLQSKVRQMVSRWRLYVANSLQEKVRSANRGFAKLNEMLSHHTPHDRVKRAFSHWVEMDRQNKHYHDQMELQQEKITTRLSGLVFKKKNYQKTRLAIACWRWCANAASMELNTLSTVIVRKKMKITKLESTCTVYRNQQIRDAAISASFEKELIGLRQKVKGLKEHQKEEKRIERDRSRRGAVLRLMSIKTVQERQDMHRRVTSSWVCWREFVGQYRQVDLAQKLEETRTQQRQAAGRISSLVERAQRERAQTVKLLLTMKQRTAAMEDQVVDHLVSSPGVDRKRRSPTIRSIHSSTLVTPPALQIPQKSPYLKFNSKKKKKKSAKKIKKKNERSPVHNCVTQDPYNLIVDQMLRAVSSKKRTLYSHNITDLLTLFQAIDLNCDGNISNAEFGDAMKRLDVQISNSQLKHLLQEMRREDGRISYHGFVQSMKHHHDALHGLVDTKEEDTDRPV